MLQKLLCDRLKTIAERMRLPLLIALTAALLLADDSLHGLPARASPADYAASNKWQNTTFAASLVPSKQVEHLFAFDISKQFLVFEVACFTDGATQLKISRDAVVMKSAAAIDVVRHSDPETVASAIERQQQPSLPALHGITIGTAATIGPNGGAGQVSAETGTPPPAPKPGEMPKDRVRLAAQLRARSIPEGPALHSVAGYLYFRKSDVKVQPDGHYHLQYLFEEEGTGATHAVTLLIPLKGASMRSNNN